MDRLMALRDALVALKGPLSNDPALQESLQRQLFSEEADIRVLGHLSTAPAH
nr:MULTISPECIES: type VI secretion system contractile sheath small subunit [unclassified Pseudomonas]